MGNTLIKVGKHFHRNADDNQAEKLAVGIVEPAADVEGPLAVALVAHRLADEITKAGVGQVRLEVVALGQVDRRDRVGAAEIDVVAIGGDDRCDIDLGQAADLFAQHLEHFGRRQPGAETRLIGHIGLLDTLGHRIEYDIGRKNGL